MDRSAVRVLVLDDEPFILKLHAHMLSGMGFTQCALFSDGGLALAAMHGGEVSPDLILLDLSMPSMDGIQFIRHLVEIRYPGSLILVSAEDERLLQTASRLVEAQGIALLGHLSKPVKPEGLAGLLRGWPGKSGPTRRGKGKPYPVEEVARGIHAGEIVNFYQPLVSVRSGELHGLEALARWRHPSDGMISPGRFITVAEENGLIEALTRLVYTRALADMKALETRGLEVQVAVNLAAVVLASVDFADFAIEEAMRAGIPPRRVVFEVTESQLVGDVRAPLDVLTRLRLMRFNLSIDDFGTGYSSLSQLRDIPFGELKIDQGFVHRASSESPARAIYDASLGLARQLKMLTVAEGVEDRIDWDMVRGSDCDFAQGYFIGRPMPPEAVPDWTRAWAEKRGAGPENLGPR